MADTNWLRQTDRALFEDLVWSRPENKIQAGKLLILGGNLHGFTAVAESFSASIYAGVGTTRALLPDKLSKSLSRLIPEADFAPSTPSGSFSRQAIALATEASDWADGVLLAGDFSKNSETEIFLETLLSKHKNLFAVAGDGLDYFLNGDFLLSRKKTAILANLGQLQELAKHNRPNPLITYKMGLYELVKALAGWSKEIPVLIVCEHQGSVVVAYEGKISTTPVSSVSLPKLSAYISVWLIQNPSEPFEAATSAVFEYKK